MKGLLQCFVLVFLVSFVVPFVFRLQIRVMWLYVPVEGARNVLHLFDLVFILCRFNFTLTWHEHFHLHLQLLELRELAGLLLHSFVQVGTCHL